MCVCEKCGRIHIKQEEMGGKGEKIDMAINRGKSIERKGKNKQVLQRKYGKKKQWKKKEKWKGGMIDMVYNRKKVI